MAGEKEEKQALRRRILHLREALTEEEAEEKSRLICGRILMSRAYRDASCLYLYMEIRREVGMARLREQALRDGKRIAVPRVEGKQMVFCYLERPEDLVSGAYGIREPGAGCRIAEEEDALLVLPGVAYDETGGRIGYGGGYYDRYLAGHPGHSLAAPAYELQICSALPLEPFDRRVPWIITETREIGGEVQ